MKTLHPSTFFGHEHAQNYDKRWKKLAAINDSLYLLSKIILQDLPPEAHILCVGVGTGRELFFLAEQFPGWRFMALDASGPMLAVCKDKAEKLGVISRIEFHEGFIESLPQDRYFDAATSFLVSQFLVEKQQRQQFFQEIRQRLKPDAYLINCDLAMPIHTQQSDTLKALWINMQRYDGLSEDEARGSTSQWNENVAVIPSADIEKLIINAGFVNPTIFYQAFFINAWVAKNQ